MTKYRNTELSYPLSVCVCQKVISKRQTLICYWLKKLNQSSHWLGQSPKIDAGEVKINKEPFNLISVLNVIVRTFSIRMEHQPVTIEFVHNESDNLWVNGDLLLFKQILNNLIGNACKFTKKGSVCCKLLIEKIDEYFVYNEIHKTNDRKYLYSDLNLNTEELLDWKKHIISTFDVTTEYNITYWKLDKYFCKRGKDLTM